MSIADLLRCACAARKSGQSSGKGVALRGSWKGAALLALAVLAVSWAAILARACAGAGPLAISFWRVCLATLLIAPWALRRRSGAHSHSVPLRARIGALAAGIFLALHFACWISSLFLT